MTQQLINIGNLPNDGTGDPLREAYSKINDNFSELYSTDFATVNTFTTGTTPNQVLFETPATTFTQATVQINSVNPGTVDSQNITLPVAISNDGTTVQSIGYGAITFGTPIATYTSDVSGGNVRVLCTPLTSSMLDHFLSYQITFAGAEIPGVDIALDGYVNSIMTTEDGLILTTT